RQSGESAEFVAARLITGRLFLSACSKHNPDCHNASKDKYDEGWPSLRVLKDAHLESATATHQRQSSPGAKLTRTGAALFCLASTAAFFCASERRSMRKAKKKPRRMEERGVQGTG